MLHRIHAFVTSFGKACRDNERAAALKKKQAEMEKAAAAKAEAEAKAAAEGKSVAEATGARVLPMRRVMPAPGTRWHREKPSGKLAVPAASRLLRRASRVAPPAALGGVEVHLAWLSFACCLCPCRMPWLLMAARVQDRRGLTKSRLAEMGRFDDELDPGLAAPRRVQADEGAAGADVRGARLTDATPTLANGRRRLI